jgi:hypothetical protein
MHMMHHHRAFDLTPLYSLGERQRSSRVYGLLAALVFVLVTQRIGISIGNFPIPVSLALFPAMLLLIASNTLVAEAKCLKLFSFLLACACISYILGSENARITSLLLYMLMCAIFVFYIPVSPSERSTYLVGLRWVFVLLSALGIVQFFLQFLIPGRTLFTLQGVLPEWILLERGYAAVNPLEYGSNIYKATSFVFLEPSVLGAFTARGIATCFTYVPTLFSLLVMLAALLVSYSGTGFLVTAFFAICYLSFTRGLIKMRILFLFAILLVSGIAVMFRVELGLDRYYLRMYEFESKGSSGYQRFLAPAYAVLDVFEGAGVPNVLFGFGPGSVDDFATVGGVIAVPNPLAKVGYEYGVLGLSLYVLLIYTAFRRTIDAGPLQATLLFQFFMVAPGTNVPQMLFMVYFLTCPLKVVAAADVAVSSAVHSDEPSYSKPGMLQA